MNQSEEGAPNELPPPTEEPRPVGDGTEPTIVGKCVFCGFETSQGKSWNEPVEELGIPAGWIFAHKVCQHLYLSRLAKSVEAKTVSRHRIWTETL